MVPPTASGVPGTHTAMPTSPTQTYKETASDSLTSPSTPALQLQEVVDLNLSPRQPRFLKNAQWKPGGDYSQSYFDPRHYNIPSHGSDQHLTFKDPEHYRG
jgi:hypothetical protein